MATYHIPFNRPALLGNELRYIREAVEAAQICGDGPFTRRCQSVLEGLTGARRVLLTTSCTHALEMAGLLLDLQPGDEVIVPSFTFVSTANAFALRGARLVFADIRSDTLNLDEQQLAQRIGPRTRAVVAVHYAGVGCAMEAIGELAGAHGLTVIEDNAHGLFGHYRGRPLGSFGDMSTLSFHETKNVTCGEGGALVLNRDDLVPRAEVLREKGTDRSRFFRGEVDKYTWVDIGSSYVPSDMLAAFLLAQLEGWRTVQERRRWIWERYRDALGEWAAAHEVRLPVVLPECDQSYHMFYLLLPSLERRQELIDHLKQRGILAVFHYQPLHLSRMGQSFGGRRGDCPVTEMVSERLLRLPLYLGLSDAEVDEVAARVREVSWR